MADQRYRRCGKRIAKDTLATVHALGHAPGLFLLSIMSQEPKTGSLRIFNFILRLLETGALCLVDAILVLLPHIKDLRTHQPPQRSFDAHKHTC